MDLKLAGRIPFFRFRFPRFSVAIQFTREGLIFVLLSLAIGAAAVNTGNNVLYFIFSLMLGLIVVSGIISRRMLMGLRANADFPEHIFSGVRSVCYLSIENRKTKIPSLGVRLTVKPSGTHPLSRYFFYIPAGSKSQGFVPFVFHKRGIFDVDELELQTRFPFSFFIKMKRIFPKASLKVYPHVYRFSEEAMARFTEGLTLESPYRGDSDQILHLRDYTPQDSSKRIHWKASARRDKLMVKEFQRERGRKVHLYFDCFPGKAAPEDQMALFEHALSFIASLALLFSERGLNINLIFPDQHFSISDSDDLIPFLAYLSEFTPSVPMSSNQSATPGTEDLVLQLCSRNIASRILPAAGKSHKVFIEEWHHLFTETFEPPGPLRGSHG